MEISIYPDIQALTHSAAEIFIATAQRAVEFKKRCSIALSGGSTPRGLYRLLSEPDYQNQLDWSTIDFFWGDERCVPPDHPDSDFKMAQMELLDRLLSPTALNIYRLEGEVDPIEAAKNYETILRTYFDSSSAPAFDLLLLGMGEDGHTASLFPGTTALHETERWVVGHFVPQLSAWRLTLTPGILNRAQLILVLVAGEAKAATLQRVLEGSYDPDHLPIQLIHPISGNIHYLVDQAAASQLQGTFQN